MRAGEWQQGSALYDRPDSEIVTADRFRRTRRRGRHRVSRPSPEQIDFAAQVRDDLRHQRPVFVEVVGEGGGWCVLAVDVDARTYRVYRDGRTLTVCWSAVSQTHIR